MLTYVFNQIPYVLHEYTLEKEMDKILLFIDNIQTLNSIRFDYICTKLPKWLLRCCLFVHFMMCIVFLHNSSSFQKIARDKTEKKQQLAKIYVFRESLCCLLTVFIIRLNLHTDTHSHRTKPLSPLQYTI